VKKVDAARKTIAALGVLLLCVMFALTPIVASAQTSAFVVDVWTSKGGQGVGVIGGTFVPGEDIVVYLSASEDCYVTIGVGMGDGPRLAELNDRPLAGGQTVTLPALPLDAADSPFGTWWVEVVAVSMAGSVYASDTVVFGVAPSAPPATPTQPTLAPVALGSATVLDALIALKMAEGSLPAEAVYDVNGDGHVTVDDARAILKWAVQ
jgi:hypothetical protein